MRTYNIALCLASTDDDTLTVLPLVLEQTLQPPEVEIINFLLPVARHLGQDME